MMGGAWESRSRGIGNLTFSTLIYTQKLNVSERYLKMSSGKIIGSDITISFNSTEIW